MPSNSINICLNISTIDGSVISSSSSPSTSSHSTSVCISKPVDKVFVFEIDVLTMLSPKRIEAIKRDHPKIRVSFASKTLDKCLSRVKFHDPESRTKEVINIDNVVEDGTDNSKKMVGKYARLRSTYKFISDQRRNSMPKDREEYPDLNIFADRWRCAKRILQLVNSPGASNGYNYANVVLAGDGVAHGALQLMRTALSSEIPIDNIYSTATRTAKEVLQIIQKRFGRSCQLVVVTSHGDTMYAARQLYHCVWTIYCTDDLEKLYTNECNFRQQLSMDENNNVV